MKGPNKKDYKGVTKNDLQLEIVSWNQVYSSLFDLVELIKKSSYTPDIIVGVSRGGWVPARILSDLLEIPNLVTVATQFYVNIKETKHEPTITQEITYGVVDRKKILVVDDLVDSGKSLKLVISHLKMNGALEIKTGTIYCKPWSKIVPDYYVKETEYWVVFPWDHKETVRKLFEKFKTLGNSVDKIKEKLISFGLNKNIINQISEEKH